MTKLRKPMMIMLGSLSLLFIFIFAYKAFSYYMIKKFITCKPAPITVSAIKAAYDSWQPKIKAAGSIAAVQGVDVTTEISGMIKTIHFTPGQFVEAGEILVELNAASEIAHLNALTATAELAKIVYERNQAQFKIQAVSQATLDANAADLKNKLAQVAEQEALIAKKTVRAPFKGRLGISHVNLGQYINPGDQIVTLQALDPIYVHFYIPQQSWVQIQVGQSIHMTTDTYPNRLFNGKITTINPIVDTASRNIQVEATLSNSDAALLPGMFSSVEIETGKLERHILLPQTAVSFNPYGEIVYVLKENGQDSTGVPVFTAMQTFVTVGETRGDQISILKGLKPNDIVVTAGQVKLKNESQVIIHNSIAPPTHNISTINE